MPKQPEFNQQKAIEVIIYIAGKVTNPDYFRILKLMYLADLMSLEEYGRFVSSDSYVAMRHGPFPSNSYDLVKKSKVNNKYGFTIENEYQICPIRPPNLDELSESDVLILDEVIKSYGELPALELRLKTHDAAWLERWQQSGNKNSIPIPIENIAQMSDHADELIDLLTNPHD